MYFDQSEYKVRCEWGLEGINQLAATSDAIIIVDVISFTTCVDAALSRGAWVYPYRWKDESLLEFAHSIDAIPAVGSRKDPEAFSLSPHSLLRLPLNAKVVLPSPNGATLSLATGDRPTFAGCLRNAKDVANAAVKMGRRISVIPAGERWEDGSLRPAFEDLVGAGAILKHLPGKRSPEAEAAIGAFLRCEDRLFEMLVKCSSGKEAADRGSLSDVLFAGALNEGQGAAQLIEGAYQAV